MKFRKKPIEHDAEQWHGFGTDSDIADIVPFKNTAMLKQEFCEQCKGPMSEHGWIVTLEGGHIVCPHDWIVTGVKSEKYPVKPDIFPLIYESVED